MTHLDSVPHWHGFQRGLQEDFLRLAGSLWLLGKSPRERGSWCLTQHEKDPAARIQKIHYFCSQNCYFLISLLSCQISPIQIDLALGYRFVCDAFFPFTLWLQLIIDGLETHKIKLVSVEYAVKIHWPWNVYPAHSSTFSAVCLIGCVLEKWETN